MQALGFTATSNNEARQKEKLQAAAAHASLPAVDSTDQWPWWSGETSRSGGGGAAAATPPRTELAIGTAAGSSHGGGDSFRTTSVEALIRGDMKLILTLPYISVDTAGTVSIVNSSS